MPAEMIPIDELIRSRRRTLTIIIEEDGRLVVRAPLRTSRSEIEEFVRQKDGWIRAKRDQALERRGRFQPKRYVEGEEFLFLGDRYRLHIENGQRPQFTFNSGFHLAAAAQPRAATLFERWYRRQALRVLTERALLYAAPNGFEFSKVQITSARKQWGSCGPKGNLRFAWRLVMAPLPVVDYVVVHELAHLRWRSHGKRFWGRVGRILPDYRAREKWLADEGFLLRLD